MNNKWHRFVKKEILGWVLCPFLLVALLPVPSVQALPEPYDHSYVIYSITRPYPLNQEEKENSFQRPRFKHQSSEGFEVDSDSDSDNAGDPPLDDSPPGSGRSTPEPDDLSHKTPIQEISDKQHPSVLKEPPLKQEVETKAYFVRYNPDKYLFKQLHAISTGLENVVCRNRQVWVQVEKTKAKTMGISDDDIVDISHHHALYELDSTLGEHSTSEQIEAFYHDTCIKTIHPVRGLTLQMGFAELKVSLTGFELKSYLHSHGHDNHLHLPPRPPQGLPEPQLPEDPGNKEQLKHYQEQLESSPNRWHQHEMDMENLRKVRKQNKGEWLESRKLAPFYEQFFPDWVGTLDDNEKPLIVERGLWGKSYKLELRRVYIENALLEAQFDGGKLIQILRSKFNPVGASKTLEHKSRTSMDSTMMLPYHVIGAMVETTANDFTYTPFAKPREEPLNRKLELKQYTENYQAHIMNFEEWMEPVIIPAVVYDFYSDSMDANAQKIDRQPRLTYWVGTEGRFKGKLLGRRVMYLDQASIPIGCGQGEPLCYFEHARYVGLEYRLGVWKTPERELQQQKQKIEQPDDSNNKDYLADRKKTPTPKAPPGSRDAKFNWWSNLIKGKGWQASDYYYQLNDYVNVFACHYLKNQAVTGGINYMAGYAGVKFALPQYSLPVSTLLYFIWQSVTTED